MAFASDVYTGNGSTTTFALTFPYVRPEHVVVFVNFVSVAYTYTNSTTVNVSPAPGNGLRVEVRRVTPLAAPLVDFTDGSILVAADLDTNALQNLYIEQELDDRQKASVFNDDATGLITAGGRRITAVANPTSAQDAATKNYVDTADALKVAKAGDSMTGALAMGANKITGMGDPTNAQDAATKTYVDATDVLKVAKAGDTMSGALAMGTNKITGLGTPTANADAATKLYVDTADALKVAKAGDTMSGALAMGTNKITGMGDPTSAQDAATKTYVDTADALKVTKAGDTMSGALAMSTNKITGLGTPTVSTDAATKAYVDTADALKVAKAGDSMTGALAMGTNRVTGMGDPISAQDAATKTYVDTADALKVAKTGDSMTGALAMGTNKVTNLGTPTASTDAASKGYVDGLVAAATLADADYGDITVSGGSTVWTIDAGAVTSTKILDGTIVNADINASAAIVDTKLDTIATALKVSNSATTATSANTASAIVARDASGNFTAGTITAALTGAASSNVLKAGDTMTGVLAVTAGTAALPAITPSGDANTGIFSPGADQLAVSTGGVQRINIEADGDINIDGGGVFYDATNNRLAIGTTGPLATLEVKGTSDSFFTQGLRVSRYDNTTQYGMITNGGGLNITVVETAIGTPVMTFNRSANGTTVTENARFDSSGRLLVGTSSSPSSGDGESSRVFIVGNTSVNPQAGLMSLARNEAATSITSNEHIGSFMFTDNTGNEFANIQCFADTNAGAADFPGRLTFSTTVDGGSSPIGRALIDNRGAFNMFAAAGGDGHVFMTGEGAGTTYYLFSGARNSTSVFGNNAVIVFQVFTNGNTQNTNNSYAGISDLKLKENIVDATSQWDDLKALQVRKYNFKEETGHQTHTQIGLVAQEVELVSPGLVNESPDRDAEGNDLGTVTKSVNYSVLYMKAVKALQEAMERIEQLETSNTDLLARVIALETT